MLQFNSQPMAQPQNFAPVSTQQALPAGALQQNVVSPQVQSATSLNQTSEQNPMMMMYQITSSLLTMMGSLMQMLMQLVMAKINNGTLAGQSSSPATEAALAQASSNSSSSNSSASNGVGASSLSNGTSAASAGGAQTVPQGLANPNSDKKPRVIIEGDSLSTKVGDSFSYADQLNNSAGGRYDFAFEATGGDMLRHHIKNDVNGINAMHDSSRQDNVVVLWGGTNDLQSGFKADYTYEQLKDRAQKYRDQGFKVVVLTSIQLDGKLNSAEKDAERKKFNDLIRNDANAPWAKVVDVASMPEFSDTHDGVSKIGGNYSSDGIHLTQKGYGLISAEVDKALQQLLGV